MPQNQQNNDWEPLTPATRSAAPSDGDWEPLMPATQPAMTQVAPPADATLQRSGRGLMRQMYANTRPDTRPAATTGGVLGQVAQTAPMAAGTLLTGGSLIEAPMATLGAVGRGALKSVAGSLVGREVGSLFGPTGREVGQVAGGIAGPMVPGTAFARLPWGVGRMFASDADYASVQAARKIAQIQAERQAGLKPSAEEVLSRIKPWGGEEAAEEPEYTPFKPSGPNAERLMREGRARAYDPLSELPTGGKPSGSALGKIGGTAKIAELPDVIVAPEPRVPVEGERPGSMFSIPREQLPGQAEARQPGATDVLRSIGKKVIFRPKVTLGTK